MIAPYSTTAFVYSIAALTALSACYLWTSRVNQFFFFGRTLPAEFASTPAARRITRVYRARVGAGLGASLLAFLGLYLPAILSVQLSFVFALLVQTLAFHLAFGRAHRDAGLAWQAAGLAGPTTTAFAPRAVSVPLLESRLPAMPPLYAAILPIAVAAAIWMLAMVAGHQGFSAVATAMDSGQASFLSGLGFGLLASSTGIFLLLRFTARNRTPMARYTIRTSILLGWIGALAVSLTVLAPSFHLVITRDVSRAILIATLALAAVHLIYGWTRIRQFTPPQIEQHGDSFWRLGLYYYNPADPALFIQRRSGPGYTLNFGNVFSWPIALLVAGNLVFLIFFAPHVR